MVSELRPVGDVESDRYRWVHLPVFRVGNVVVLRFGRSTSECGGCVVMDGWIQNVQLSNRRAKL